MRVLVTECSGRNLFNIIDALASHLCFGAHLDRTFLFEARPGHSSLSLFLLQLLHDLVLLDAPEVVLVGNTLVRIYAGLCRTYLLADAVNIRRRHRSLQN